MRTFIKVLAIALLASTLYACSWLTPYHPPLVQGVLIEPETLNSLQEGLSKPQVRAMLGPPFGADPFNPQVWDYVLKTNQTALKEKYVGHLRLWFDQEGYLVKWQRLD